MIKLSFFEQFAVNMGLSLLMTLAAQPVSETPVKLSEYEQFAVSLALSFLMFLGRQTTNTTAQSAIQSGVAVLQALLYGQAVAPVAIQAAITFLQQLLNGQVLR